MILLISLLVTTVILVASSILVMAEEFKGMPTYLQHTSSMLVHNKKHRTAFICGVISLMTLTSIIGVLTCPITVRPYEEVMVLEQQQVPTTIAAAPLPVQEKLMATTSRSSLDHFVLTFLEAALSDESTEEGNTVPSTENKTLKSESSNIELKLTRVVNDRAPGRSRREFFRFYRCVLWLLNKKKDDRIYLRDIYLQAQLGIVDLEASYCRKNNYEKLYKIYFMIN